MKITCSQTWCDHPPPSSIPLEGKKRKGPSKRSDKKDKEFAAVLFLPRTHESELARRIRNKEKEINKISDYKVEVVERAGTKVRDLLIRNDPVGA